jgi:hypothetical protein
MQYMPKVLIRMNYLKKAVCRFERKKGADIVFFDRIADNPDLHFSIAKPGTCRPKRYCRTEQVGVDGKMYDIFLPEEIGIARF